MVWYGVFRGVTSLLCFISSFACMKQCVIDYFILRTLLCRKSSLKHLFWFCFFFIRLHYFVARKLNAGLHIYSLQAPLIYILSQDMSVFFFFC